jgi:hypothetical protein
VPTPTPTLRWERFPTSAAEKKAPDLVARMRRVRYDLIIARESNSASGDIVYAREGLPAPIHTVERPLQPGARYFWSVRARFELDGRERVTDWSTTHAYAAVRVAPPGVYTYRFRVHR